LLALGALLLVIQIVPYGRDHENPPVTQEVKWDSARTRELAVGACYDCHSNLTEWPWYSNVAPVSWLVYSDVQEGREKLNFSREGSMPPLQYKPLHPAGRLSDAEREELARGIERTLAADPPIEGEDD
jgi:mono/diheme cytochrome c family protein